MLPDPDIPSFNDNPHSGGVPPLLPASQPPVMGFPPPLVTAPLPTQPPKLVHKSSPVRRLLAILLSLCLGSFLGDAVVSLVDDSLILFFDVHLLTVIRGMVFLFAMLLAIAVYGLIGLTPMIPKRLFIPVTLFNPLAGLVAIPAMIFAFDWIQQVTWIISLSQVIFGLWILHRVQGGFKFRWPPVGENQLAARRFSWLNLSVFVLVNAFVLLPTVVVYLALSAALAVDHFSDGFLALRPGGLTVQVRNYVRTDGKTIQLIPMSHVGESAFYRRVSQSFPTNATILLEGVTDNRNLLTNKITYKRMATSLGLAEQEQEFQPSCGELVQADVDVEQFATNTIDFMNLVMLLHARGVNAGNVLKLMQYSPPPDFYEQLLDDLLRKRNQHLMKQIQSRLEESENLIVPWGAAHMPEIAREIQKSGFRLDETQDYKVISFDSAGKKSAVRLKGADRGKPK